MNAKEVSAATLPELARFTVEEFVESRQIISIDESSLPDFREQRAGTFVTLYKNGQLRGCIGTISPVYENVLTEVINNAISSCQRDPRFRPVQKDELPFIKYSVSVLMPAEPVDSIDLLDPQRYGVIVTASNNRRGLLLPRLEGIKTVHEQVYHAMAKGGIHPNEPISLFRFESIEHKE
jgi:AmmeMemoRadiSam system protein A